MWDLGKYQKGRIWASTGKVEIRASTGSGRNPGEMLENPKQAKRSKQTQGKVVGPSMTSRVYQQMTRISQKSNTIMIKEGGMPQYDNRKCHKCPNMTIENATNDKRETKNFITRWK